MRRPGTAAAIPLLLGTGWLLALFAPLLSPARALANRDVPLFHLPLRTAFRQLAEQAGGLPQWNPWIHGGQPILSNPNYGAFYPPSWLVFLVAPSYTLNLLILGHAALAFAGAWWLARRLGGGREAAALAAVGYAGSGATLSLTSALTIFCGMAWLPWVLGWTDEALRAARDESRRWRRPALLAGAALGLQLLNGEPTAVVLSGLGVLGFAASSATARPARRWSLLRLLPPLALLFAAGLALAAVQWLPTAGRFLGSPRAGGLDAARAAVWSSPPARAVELVFPRVFGDPVRDSEGLYFGWGLHDRDFPYLPSLYPGLLLTVLAVAAVARWPFPRRAAWALLFALGAFLALGRHNPLYEPLRQALPVLAVLRFPEKFAALAAAAVTFAGALGWGWLLREREEGRPERADFPLALALVLLAAAAGLTALLYARPEVGEWFVRGHASPTEGTAEKIARGAAFLRREGWWAMATAASAAALLALCRSPRGRRIPAAVLAAAAVALLAGDLWRHGHGLVQTAPAALYQGAPPLVLTPESRLFVQEPEWDEPSFVPRRSASREGAENARLRVLLERGEPYSGLLWGISYALHEDFDLLLTPWAAAALRTLHEDWDRPELAWRFLGAWNVGTVLLRKDPAAWAAEAARNPAAPLMRRLENPHRLPRHRFVPHAVFHADRAVALASSRGEGYAVMRREHLVRPEKTGEAVYPRPPQPLGLEDRGGRLRLRYRAESAALFVAAYTFDEGWRARLDGLPLPLHPTAAGQIAAELPAGEHDLVLEYRDRLLPAGAAITLTTLIAVLAALLAAPGRRRA